jgi:glycosyltransferase involved in cell wall biosynthesis
MKILCVIDSLGSGGAQKQLVELAKGFSAKGHDVSFLVYHDINFYEMELLASGIKVNKILETNYIIRIVKMWKFIRTSNSNAVLSFLQSSNFICEMATLPTKKWNLVVGERSANPNIKKSFKLRSYRWFHLLANQVVSNSYANIKIVQSINPLIKDKNCSVIYNMIDFSVWQSNESQNNLVSNKFKLIVVASHRYLKNAKGLIKAVSKLSNTEQDRLTIDWYGGAQPDNSFEEANQMIESYGLQNVFFFHKPTADIANQVATADALGLFSFYEGLPNTVCEGMAMGKVVITSNVSDVPLLLAHCPSLLFDPTDVNEITKVLREAMNLTQEEYVVITKKNIERARHLFDEDKIVNSYLKLLEKPN